jgi:hypothetical protein
MIGVERGVLCHQGNRFTPKLPFNYTVRCLSPLRYFHGCRFGLIGLQVFLGVWGVKQLLLLAFHAKSVTADLFSILKGFFALRVSTSSCDKMGQEKTILRSLEIECWRYLTTTFRPQGNNNIGVWSVTMSRCEFRKTPRASGKQAGKVMRPAPKILHVKYLYIKESVGKTLEISKANGLFYAVLVGRVVAHRRPSQGRPLRDRVENKRAGVPSRPGDPGAETVGNPLAKKPRFSC